jgi:hypothetical protein
VYSKSKIISPPWTIFPNLITAVALPFFPLTVYDLMQCFVAAFFALPTRGLSVGADGKSTVILSKV